MRNIYLNKTLKKGVALSMLLAASTATTMAQDLNAVANIQRNIATDNKPVMRIPQLTKSPMKVIENVSKAKVSTRTLSEITTKDGNNAKPGTYYTVNEGVYNLVPGFAVAQDNANNVIYSDRGILGYLDRDMTFKNKTPLCDTYTWEFWGNTDTTDSINMHPFFPNNGYSLETPSLRASLNGIDSTYQMGTYYDQTNNKTVKGSIILNGGAYVYNVDVDAEPFLNTYFGTTNTNDPWNNILFGNDSETKPFYLEIFDAPLGGPVVLQLTHFFVATPLNVDLTNTEFEVEWWELDQDGKQWLSRKTFKIKPTTKVDYENLKIRLWTFIASDETLTVMVNNDFAVKINGPQDGTQWALLHQIDRANFTDSQRNTTFFVPTIGSMKDQYCQYNFGIVEDGQITQVQYCTSLDIHQRVITPYMILCNDDATMAFIEKPDMDFDINGEERSFIISDWYGGSPLVNITAKVIESTDGDWLKVTQPTPATVDGYDGYFRTTFTATSKDFLTEGRRATVRLTDSKGFSRDIVVYQGDRKAVSVESIMNANSQIKINVTENNFEISYPEDYNWLEIYNLSGICVNRYNLGKSGQLDIPANLPKGIYTFVFKGNKTQSIKVLK